ncbi:MAG: hypothetical protein LBG71_02465 [Clostridiales Family XIII bacterium]|nr:hypothetical protein [Clostridiales Family XIII bacterium]
MNIDNNLKTYETRYVGETLRFYRNFINKISSLKADGVLENKTIVVTGYWGKLSDIKEILEGMNININWIADNNTKKQGKTRCGVPVRSLESLVDIGRGRLVILVVTPTYGKELSAQLAYLGFEKNVHFFVFDAFGEENPTEADFLIGADIWAKAKDNARAGYAVYCEIAAKYPRMTIWLMHQPSIGDLHIFSLFLPSAMKVSSVRDCDCVIVVTKNSVKRYAEALGYRNIEIASLETATCLCQLLKLAGDKLTMKNAVFHGATYFFEPLLWQSDLNFADSFTKFVFGFEDVPAPIYFDLPKRKDAVRKLFLENHLIPGKTVFISPYAGMFRTEITKEQWGHLVDSLIEKGYTVCTNCAGEKEAPLPNTSAPFVELRDCVEFAEMAGYFIGIRSGLCDAISEAKCHKFVIYDTGCLYTPPSFFGFADMNIGSDIVELVNDGFNADELIAEMLECF